MTAEPGPRGQLLQASLPLMCLEADKEKKCGDAYTIRAESYSDLIFERALSRSPQRVLLIHSPHPLDGDRRII